VSRDGRMLVSASTDQTVRLWSPQPPVVFARTAVEGAGGDLWFALLSSDRRELITGGKADRIETRPTAHLPAPPREAPGRFQAIATSRDGSRRATGGSDKTVRLWDRRTGELVGLLPDQPQGVWCLAFSADGKRLAVGTGLWKEKKEGGSVRVYTVAS